MIVPDTNLLLYAEVTAFPEHAAAKRWWETTLSGADEVGIALVALFGFVRIGSNPRIMSPALDIDNALRRVEAWLARPQVRVLVPGPRHLEIAFRLLRTIGAGANLTTDAQLAAHAIENNGTLYSNDTDFARFGGLSWRNPLDDE